MSALAYLSSLRLQSFCSSNLRPSSKRTSAKFIAAITSLSGQIKGSGSPLRRVTSTVRRLAGNWPLSQPACLYQLTSTMPYGHATMRLFGSSIFFKLTDGSNSMVGA